MLFGEWVGYENMEIKNPSGVSPREQFQKHRMERCIHRFMVLSIPDTLTRQPILRSLIRLSNLSIQGHLYLEAPRGVDSKMRSIDREKPPGPFYTQPSLSAICLSIQFLFDIAY
jgi:hypothetical protein